MTNIITYVQSRVLALQSDRRGVTALEYGLIAALIAAVIVAGETSLGSNVNVLFNSLAGKI